MAYENTHIMMADAMRRQLTAADLKDRLCTGQDAYFLGSVFPDVLSYSRDKRAMQIAADLHGDDGKPTNRIVFKMLNAIKGHNAGRRFAFVAGYLSHCAVDITLHPMIYYLCGYRPDADARRAASASYLHWHFETIVDKRLNDRFYLEECIRPQVLVELDIARLTELPPAMLAAALKRQLTYFGINRRRLFYVAFCWLSRFNMVPPESVAGFYANLQKDKTPLPEPIAYQDPVTGEAQRTTLAEWKDAAIKMGCRMLEAAWDFHHGRIDAAACRKAIPGQNLATGRLGHTKAAIRFSSPAPVTTP